MPINPHDIDARFSCDFSSGDCTYSNCNECGSDQGDKLIGEGQFDGNSVVYYE